MKQNITEREIYLDILTNPNKSVEEKKIAKDLMNSYNKSVLIDKGLRIAFVLGTVLVCKNRKIYIRSRIHNLVK